MKNKFSSARLKKIIVITISVSVLIVSMAACSSFNRKIKDTTSDFGGGLNRTITIYDYNGNIIKTYEGKCDIEESENKVLFDINGKRTIIYNAIVIAEEN
ncbi:DUF5052 family protein [Candidatus Pseudoruminococcus sp.]|uniref:DUF5052 family protein n=1 Tax=Candidatus Pseudoruminococcus sp. TaxID=3101048 RepID=UPI00399B71AD